MKSSAVRKFCTKLACVVLSTAACVCAFAQPPRPFDEQDTHRATPEQERSPEFLRMRLRRMIEDSERMQREAADALERLDGGASPEEVLRSTRLPMLRLLRGRTDAPGGDGPRGDGPRSELPRGDGLRGDGARGGDGPRGVDGRGPMDAPRADRPFGPGQRGDRRPGSDRERGAFPPHRALSEEERALVSEKLREVAPRLHEALQDVQGRDPRLASSMLERVVPMVHASAELRERDPKYFELRVGEMRSTFDVMRSVHEYRSASKSGMTDDALGALLGTVREAIARNFDDRLAIQRHEAEELARRVESLRDEIDRALSDREQAIERGVERVRKDERPRGR